MSIYRVALWVLVFPFAVLGVGAAGMLGLLVGAVLYLMWLEENLWIVPLAVIGFIATFAVVIAYMGAIEWLHDRVEKATPGKGVSR